MDECYLLAQGTGYEYDVFNGWHHDSYNTLIHQVK